ncbi:S-adenosyl-L-methionine-dependent methyltransferase [Aspergillus karnatakaensis]|uniref:S-adenosyl-L-methionine-dependent methyltransferase n=1 Tax=Aspergillus karnatakaensis TaxID=1810916 RepID=UPI003CCE2501
MSRIIELVAHIQQRTADIDEYLRKRHFPFPKFDEDGLSELNLSTGEIAKALHQLILGPSMCLRPMYNAVSPQAIYKYKIASKMPIHGEISFTDLAKDTDLSEVNIRRMLRHAMLFHRVFKEPREGFVAHTAASRRLAEDPLSDAVMGYMFEEVWPGFAHLFRLFPALEQFNSDEPNKTGSNHYLDTDKPAFEYYAVNPDKARRFATAMTAFADGHGNSPLSLVQSYPWKTIGKGTVVDVGGSTGNVSTLIAIGMAEKLPDDLRERVHFQAHDFFTEQTVIADAYIFRNIFHNWSDSRCIEILRALIPTLRTGARIIVNDYVLPAPGTMPHMKELAVRQMDLIMLTLFNSRERTRSDWIDLFKDADPRFSDVKIWTPEEIVLSGMMSLV